MQRIIVLMCVFLMWQNCYSQKDSINNYRRTDEEIDSKHSFGIKAEYSYQNAKYFNLGVSFLNPSIIEEACATYIMGPHGVSLSSDFSLGNKNIIIPKISYEATFFIFTGKINAGFATDSKLNEYIITPEVGVSVLGFIYVLYGYNFTTKNQFDLRGNRIVVGLNFIPRIRWKDGAKTWIWR